MASEGRFGPLRLRVCSGAPAAERGRVTRGGGATKREYATRAPVPARALLPSGQNTRSLLCRYILGENRRMHGALCRHRKCLRTPGARHEGGRAQKKCRRARGGRGRFRKSGTPGTASPALTLHVADHSPMTRRANHQPLACGRRVASASGRSPSGHSDYHRCATAPEFHRTFPGTRLREELGTAATPRQRGLGEDGMLTISILTLALGAGKIKRPSTRFCYCPRPSSWSASCSPVCAGKRPFL